MQLILDNLIALLVSGSLAIMLLTQQTSTRQDTMERQSVYAAKVQALTFSEWLEDDIVKLGARFGEDRDRFSFRDSTIAGLRYTTQFDYAYNDAENADGSVDRVEVRYRLSRTDSVLIAAATTRPVAPARYAPLYSLVRSERAGTWNGTAWVGTEPAFVRDRGYGSPTGLSYFHLEPRTSDGDPIRDSGRASEADYIHAQFSVIPTHFPVHRARYIRGAGLSWASTIEIRPF